MDPSLYGAAARGDVDVLKRFKNQVTKQVTSPTQNTFLHVLAQFGDGSAPASYDPLSDINSDDPVRYPDHSKGCDKEFARCVGEMLRDQSSEVVQSLLTWKNSAGETALYIAARNRYSNIARELIARAKAVDGSGDDEVTKNMLRLANENGDTALHEAVKNKDLEMVRMLVEHDPDFEHLPNHTGETPLYLAIERMDDITEFGAIVESILSICTSPGFGGPGGENALHVTAKLFSGSSLILRMIEKNKSLTKQVDDQGLTPLHHAAYHSNSKAAEEFLKADKSMAYVRATVEKHDAMTALHLATSNEEFMVMSEILRNCPDCWVMTTSKGQNILHLAAASPYHRYAVKFVLRQPWAINLINQKDNLGNTPFHLLLYSVESCQDVIPLLHHPRLDLNAINMKGSTPLDTLYDIEIDGLSKAVSREQVQY